MLIKTFLYDVVHHETIEMLLLALRMLLIMLSLFRPAAAAFVAAAFFASLDPLSPPARSPRVRGSAQQRSGGHVQYV